MVTPRLVVDVDHADLCGGRPARMHVRIPEDVAAAGGVYFVVDIYVASKPVHPEGHVGWWRCPVDADGRITAELARTARGIEVSFEGREVADAWVHEDAARLAGGTLDIRLVLRRESNGAILFEESVRGYVEQAELATVEARCAQLSAPRAAGVPRGFVWPRNARVLVTARELRERDAIGSFCFQLGAMLAADDVPVRFFALDFDRPLRGLVRPSAEILDEVTPDDVLLVMHSLVDPFLEDFVALPCRKVFYTHNITPPRFFQIYDAEMTELCEAGMEQLGLARHFDACLGNSELSVAQLTERLGDAAPPVEVCPPLLGPPGLVDAVSDPAPAKDGRARLLYTGRLAPHKRVEDLFELLAALREGGCDAELVATGMASPSSYRTYLEYLLGSRYADHRHRIHLPGSVSAGRLRGLYESADAFVSMSEHEGYCVPVVEAMAFDVPAFAYGGTAARETLGGAGICFAQKDFVSIAHDVAAVLADAPRRERILAGQRTRFATLMAEADGGPVWRALETALDRADPV